MHLPDSLVSITAIIAMLLVAGGALGLLDRKHFSPVWLRYRTGSLLLPIVLHNFGNSITLFL